MTAKPEPDNLAAALARFQADLPRLGKGNTADTGSYKYSYADLTDVSEVVLPLLGKQGLSFSAVPNVTEGQPVLVCKLRHVSGECDEAIWQLPPKGSPQQIGSAITYFRRYSLCAMTGVAPGGDDDDGREAEKSSHRPGDPTLQQEQLFDDFVGEIGTAEEQATISDIGARVKAAHRAGRLTKWQHDRLGRLAGERVATFKPAEVLS